MNRWIRPWQGEGLVGEVIAVVGQLAQCRAINGEIFFIETKELARVAEVAAPRAPAALTPS